MARTVIIDEIHITLRVPADLGEEQAEEVRNVLLTEAFLARLRRAARAAVRAHPELNVVRVALSR